MENRIDDNYTIFKLCRIYSTGRKKGPDNICISSQKPTTFGRVQSSEVQVRLLSKTTPLMISRKHATISVDGESVTVCDHDSMNGVYIDNVRIVPCVPHKINAGEKIAFGCGVGNNSPEFEYILQAVDGTSVSSTEEPVNLSSPTKRKKIVEPPALTIIESNAAQIKEQEEKIHNLTNELQKKEREQHELTSKLEQTEKGLLEKFERQRENLENERNSAEKELKILLENQLCEKENVLRNEYDEQIKCLQIERDLVEQNLQAELSKKLSEKDKAYQQVLEEQKEQLEKQMSSKEQEKNVLLAELQEKEGLLEKYKSVEENQKQLEDCLEELRKEIVEKEQLLKQQDEVTKKAKIDAKQDVIQTMEDEFTCIICQELFIDSTTLACAHTFCEICLRLWMRKKKNCPVCRRKIKDKAVRSLVLDSAVDKMIESMSDEVKERRTTLVRQRAEQKQKDDATEDPDGIKNMFHHLGEDTGSADEADQSRGDRNDRVHDRNRRNQDLYHRRDNNYSRRSRSRSPRYHQRHRPYHHDNRNHQNNNYNYNNLQGFNQQHNNNVPILHHYPVRGGNQQFFNHGNLNHQNYYDQPIRCYNCGKKTLVAPKRWKRSYRTLLSSPLEF